VSFAKPASEEIVEQEQEEEEEELGTVCELAEMITAGDDMRQLLLC
jgi:hypothetical protein